MLKIGRSERKDLPLGLHRGPAPCQQEPGLHWERRDSSTNTSWTTAPLMRLPSMSPYPLSQILTLASWLCPPCYSAYRCSNGGGEKQQPVNAVLDSGSTVTLAHPTTLGRLPKPHGTLLVSCIHRDIWEVLATDVMVSLQRRAWPLLVRFIPKLPVPPLLGRDWPGFPMGPATRPHPCHHQKRPAIMAWVQPACMAQEEGDTTG